MDDALDGRARVGPVADETIRAQKLDAVARLVPGIAHELNNPLAAIVGFAELLRTDPRLPDDMRRQAELLAGETARTRQLVHALLDFLRERPPERHEASVRASSTRPGPPCLPLASSQLDVRIDIPDDLPPVEIDRAQIQLVLVNLLQEALDVLADGSGRGSCGSPPSREVGDPDHDQPRRDDRPSGPTASSRGRSRQALVAAHAGTLRGLRTGLSIRRSPSPARRHVMLRPSRRLRPRSPPSVSSSSTTSRSIDARAMAATVGLRAEGGDQRRRGRPARARCPSMPSCATTGWPA